MNEHLRNGTGLETFVGLVDRFRPFYDAVKMAHETAERPHSGHGLDHDVTVSMLGLNIAPDVETGVKAWCAGLLHSVDRMVDYKVPGRVESAIRTLAGNLIDEFDESDLEEIIQAALRHGELNQGDQSLTQQCLMDADRLANLMPAVVIRAGQLYPGIPALEFDYLSGERNPETTYKEPCSVLDDLRNNLAEYPPKLRMPQARSLSIRYESQLRAFIASVEGSNLETGLVGIEL